jgi:hypothetical protein
MKKIVIVIVFIQSLFSCRDNSNIKKLENTPSNIGSNLIDKADFTDINQAEIDFIKSKKDILHSKAIDKIAYNEILEEHQKKLQSELPINFEKYSELINNIKENNKKAKTEFDLDKKVFSSEAISTVEKIRDLLNTSTDEKSLRKNFKDTKELIFITKLSSNEKKFFSIRLDLLQEIAFQESASGKIKGTNAGPKCKWYQWGCVFFMTTAQVGVIFAYWAANDLLGNSALSALVAEYGLDYIAECCGFCNCTCPDGCPSYF